ncbi:hypothetical protein Dda_4454 [Drechslerella dactyloides]|uniref:Uncharacterized protein n=1 Tax=Drechslerella dactyloides TaxID=74499 RepID=A0AAD6NJA5_DREDA|nr:hypothetical protein Dda_4454 [Drechslerella dactyloides]
MRSTADGSARSATPLLVRQPATVVSFPHLELSLPSRQQTLRRPPSPDGDDDDDNHQPTPPRPLPSDSSRPDPPVNEPAGCVLERPQAPVASLFHTCTTANPTVKRTGFLPATVRTATYPYRAPADELSPS